jgi:hypothetical protein
VAVADGNGGLGAISTFDDIAASSIGFSGNGKRVALVESRGISVLDLSTATPVMRPRIPLTGVTSVGIGDEGSAILADTQFGTAVVDLASGQVTRMVGGHSLLSTGGSDAAALRDPQTAIVVDLAGRVPDRVVRVPEPIVGMALSGDGLHLAIASSSSPLLESESVGPGATTLRMYQLNGDTVTQEWSTSIPEVVFSNIRYVVVADDGSIVALSNLFERSVGGASVSDSSTAVFSRAGQRMPVVPGRAGDIDAVRQRLVTFGVKGETAVWDLRTGSAVGQPYDTAAVDDLTNGFDGRTNAAVFRPDGSIVSVGSVLALWRVNQAALVASGAPPGARGTVRAQTLEPSSALIATVDEFLAAARDPRENVAPIDHARIAWASESGRIGVVESTEQGPRVRAIGRHDRPVSELIASSDGTILVSLDSRTVQVHDVASGVELLRFVEPELVGSGGAALAPPTTPDDPGPWLEGWTLHLDADLDLDLDPTTLVARACEAAGRTLTHEEWDQFMPDLPYDPPCTSS